jgi:phospholipid/cholesterol/gamma-HCH transport system substrate-binding protein
MENKAHAMAAGIFVVLMAVLLIGLASWLTRDTGSRDPYEISTREAVTGLQAQAPVRYRGVDVGKVASIGFDPKAEGNVLLHLEIDREAPVTRDTFAMLNLQGITGLAFIQLDDHGNPAPRLAPEDGHPPRIPLKRSLLSKLESQGEEILGKVDEATARINKLLSDENQRRFSGALANLDTAAANASELTKHLDVTVTQRLDPALAAAPAPPPPAPPPFFPPRARHHAGLVEERRRSAQDSCRFRRDRAAPERARWADRPARARHRRVVARSRFVQYRDAAAPQPRRR